MNEEDAKRNHAVGQPPARNCEQKAFLETDARSLGRNSRFTTLSFPNAQCAAALRTSLKKETHQYASYLQLLRHMAFFGAPRVSFTSLGAASPYWALAACRIVPRGLSPFSQSSCG